MERNRDQKNIFWFKFDAYATSWKILAANVVHVVFIDALHDFESKLSDIWSSFVFRDAHTLIFDDYGHPAEEHGVRAAVDTMAAAGHLSCGRSVGEEAGAKALDAPLVAAEGIACTIRSTVPRDPFSGRLWYVFRSPPGAIWGSWDDFLAGPGPEVHDIWFGGELGEPLHSVRTEHRANYWRVGEREWIVLLEDQESKTEHLFVSFAPDFASFFIKGQAPQVDEWDTVFTMKFFFGADVSVLQALLVPGRRAGARFCLGCSEDGRNRAVARAAWRGVGRRL
jgi:hypothetical protein